MPDPLFPLVLDLLQWLGPSGRPAAEVMDAWRTSCPRLPVWETANDHGLVEQRHEPGRGRIVVVSPRGERLLTARRTGGG
ncbi:MAG: hypothetical protein KDA22_06885, partial [Phycisphaerales bacterium]|nr:hypothetical protein [Phycisphaerales bacterium]